MAELPRRSIRLQKKTSESLDRLGGSSGEIFYDADNRALRLYTGDGADRIIFASRTWVLNNTFSGNYNNLTNRPVIPADTADLTNSAGFIVAADLPNENLAIIANWGDVVNLDTPTELGQQYIVQVPVTAIESEASIQITVPTVDDIAGLIIGQIVKIDSVSGTQHQLAGGIDNSYTITATVSGQAWATVKVIYSGIRTLTDSTTAAVYHLDASLYQQQS
jgi:hypothetical protein